MTEKTLPIDGQTRANPSSRIRWTSKTGAWLGVGASPGGMLLGAATAAAYDGPIPLLSIVLGVGIVALLLWYQGRIGLKPPLGDGGTLNEVTPHYFDTTMQRVLGGVLALGMIGWFGFNVGLGGAALSALLHLPEWVGPLLLGAPILWLSLRGMKMWNGLATVATASALVLVALVTWRLADHSSPITLKMGSPATVLADVAVFIGFASVFSIRAPDFSAGLSTRTDLTYLVMLFCGALIGVALAGVGLQQGTGSADLVGTLAGPDGLPMGNLLVAMAVIGPVFTTLFSGAPALKAAIGLQERRSMVLVGVIGIGLAIARFDLYLLPWLRFVASMLPPIVVAMATEATLRRHGWQARLVPLWTWVPGSVIAVGLTAANYRYAPVIGLVLTLMIVAVWALKGRTSIDRGSG